MLQIFTSSQIETPNIFTCSIKALRFPFLSAPPAKRFCPAPPSRSSQKHKSPRSRQVRRWKIGGSCVMLKDTSAGFWRLASNLQQHARGRAAVEALSEGVATNRQQ